MRQSVQGSRWRFVGLRSPEESGGERGEMMMVKSTTRKSNGLLEVAAAENAA